jgi:Leucine-rich repeat (LRR) protein
VRLDGNKIDSLSSFPKLADLREIYLSKNQLIRICFNGRMPNLDTLDVSDNLVSDWTLLAKDLTSCAPNLQDLVIRGNPSAEGYV